MPAEIKEFKPRTSPEQAGGEFYDEVQFKAKEKEFEGPEYKRRELADKTAELIQFPGNKQSAEVHHEAGIPLPREISETDKTKKLEELISKGAANNAHAYELNRQLEAMLEDKAA